MADILKRLSSVSMARGELICFPYAGAGPRVFRDWPKRISRVVNISAVQLAGREERVSETPLAHLPTVVEQLVTAIEPLADAPLVLFGHSLGATLAAHVAQELLQGDRKGVLFVSARRPPWPEGQSSRVLSRLSERELLEGLWNLGGIAPEITADRELAEIVLPALKADVLLADSPQWLREKSVSCPVVALCGTRDAEVPIRQMREWSRFTSGAFQSIPIDGDHFFVDSRVEEVIEIVDSVVRRFVAM